MHANALAWGTVAMVTRFSASPNKETVILPLKDEKDEGISMGGQGEPSMT